MTKQTSFILTIVLLLAAASAKADWSTTTSVGQVNVGGNGRHGTFVSLSGFAFSGCSSTAVAVVEGADPNYKEIVSTLLAAKLADRNVRLMFSGCSAGYSVVREIIVF